MSIVSRILNSTNRPVVYTCHQRVVKHALDYGHLNIDTRASYGNPIWALPAEYVMAFKEQGLPVEKLMSMYHDFLQESLVKNAARWKQITTMRSMVISCDEAVDSDRAARFVLRGVIMNYLIDLGLDPVHGGEIYKNDHLHYNDLMAMVG